MCRGQQSSAAGVHDGELTNSGGGGGGGRGGRGGGGGGGGGGKPQI